MKTYIRVTGELPGKTQVKLMESNIGYEDAGDGDAWEKTITRWLNHGWRNDNVKGMVDKHAKGWADMDRKRGGTPTPEPTMEAW